VAAEEGAGTEAGVAADVDAGSFAGASSRATARSRRASSGSGSVLAAAANSSIVIRDGTCFPFRKRSQDERL
jgi:hypothetical protein